MWLSYNEHISPHSPHEYLNSFTNWTKKCWQRGREVFLWEHERKPERKTYGGLFSSEMLPQILKGRIAPVYLASSSKDCDIPYLTTFAFRTKDNKSAGCKCIYPISKCRNWKLDLGLTDIAPCFQGNCLRTWGRQSSLG